MIFKSFSKIRFNYQHYAVATAAGGVVIGSAAVVAAKENEDGAGSGSSIMATSRRNSRETVDGQVLKRQLTKPTVQYPLWDYNWDGRMTPETTLEAQSKSMEEPVTGTTRHIILVRHGQYKEQYEDDGRRKLTRLGRLQAEKTGRRLRVLQTGIDEKFGSCHIKKIYSSDMTRAKETAAIISKHLGLQLQPPDDRLNEAIPAPIIPVRRDIDAEMEIDENRGRIEDAFRYYFFRANPSEDEFDESKPDHEFEVIVCHGNIIRFFFCRALQLPPEAWLRLSIFNCSMTYFIIKPNGYVSCRMLGDIGHLGYEESTFSMLHGFAWS